MLYVKLLLKSVIFISRMQPQQIISKFKTSISKYSIYKSACLSTCIDFNNITKHNFGIHIELCLKKKLFYKVLKLNDISVENTTYNFDYCLKYNNWIIILIVDLASR